MASTTLLNLLEDTIDVFRFDTKNLNLSIGVHVFCAIAILLFVVSYLIPLLVKTYVTPSHPKGGNGRDYEALKGNRKSLVLTEDAPMVQFSVATANFGGIFTENGPWIGTVHPEAARLQVEAGARAIVLDVWPDTADPTRPMVCAMVGTGHYSNWKRATRNALPVGEILNAAILAAFDTPQASDPFFVILKLHGHMTAEYLNTLGDIVGSSIAGHAMPSAWNKAANQSALCSATFSEFMGQAFVIVIPDSDGIGTSAVYNLLGKSTPSYAAFLKTFMNTRMGEVTNAIERAPNTILFEPSNIGALTVANQPPCNNTEDQLTLPQAGFCLVQPPIGGTTTNNDLLFKANSWKACSIAQFVAVNLFSPSDSQLDAFFETFGTVSFKRMD